MQKELLKVALIGVGSVGKKYARMITAGEVPHMKLSAVVIRRDELIEWGESLVNTDGDNARIFRSAEELFETGESCYDAVIIATPHKTHKELALKAFAKGKAVLCDKPAAADIASILRNNAINSFNIEKWLCSVESENTRRLMVYYNNLENAIK